MVDQKTPAARPGRPRWWRAPRVWWVAGMGLAGLLIVGAAALEIWEHPPGWLHFPRVLIVTMVHWTRVHWLTSGAVGIMVTLLLYVLQLRAERHRNRADRQQPEPRWPRCSPSTAGWTRRRGGCRGSGRSVTRSSLACTQPLISRP